MVTLDAPLTRILGCKCGATDDGTVEDYDFVTYKTGEIYVPSEFHFIETRMTAYVDPSQLYSNMRYSVMSACDAAKIAQRSFALDRFHRDPNIPDERADQVMHDWLFDLEATCTIIGIPGAAFLAYKDEDDLRRLMLGAVAPEAQRQGIGRNLWLSAIAFSDKTVVADILAHNPIINLYASFGAKFCNVINTYHYHRG